MFLLCAVYDNGSLFEGHCDGYELSGSTINGSMFDYDSSGLTRRILPTFDCLVAILLIAERESI